MTTEVVTVGPDTPVAGIAQILLSHAISAVPVVDETGAPVGMVSEGDLIGRDEAARDARRDWWLALLAEGQELNPDFLASLRPPQQTAKDVMMAPVVTVSEDTDSAEIARLLAAYRIKRVPVLHDGAVVGIVSRADLLRGLVAERSHELPPKPPGLFSAAIERFDRRFLHPDDGEGARPLVRPAAEALGEEKVSASDFRSLVVDFKHGQSQHRREERQAEVRRRREKVKELIDHHIADESWQALLHEAREAAEHGEREFLLLRFPSAVCSDGGRAINVPDPEWPGTLRGEAAEIYLRWEHDLKPHGFHLSARVLDFPGGVPGDVGLFLVWGE